jgi:putative ABC transport system permease protein
MRPIILAVRNMFRQKIRLVLTLVTLVLAGAVFITVFNLRATISNSMNQMTQMQSYDLQVSFSKEYRIDEIGRELGKIIGVQAVDTWITSSSNRIRPDSGESNGISLTALNPNSDVISAPVIIEGRWLKSFDQNAIVITSMLMKNEPDLQVGQDMMLKINDRNYPFHIVGEAMAGGSTAYTNYDYLANLLHNKTRASTVLITMDKSSGMTSADLKTRLDSQLKTDGFLIASIQTSVELRGNTESNFGSVLILLILMALILGVVGGLGLMGTMSINVIERTREIGVMRAIGSSKGGILVVFMTEGVGIGLMSCLFSIPVSFPITSIVASSIGILATGTPWTGSFTPTGMFIWIVLVIVLSLLANYFPARSASRLTVREVLAYE